jgi:hypothetical protein
MTTEKDNAHEQKIRLWVSTIEALHDLKDSEPVSTVPMAATKLDEAIHIIEDRFAQFLFETTMERYSTTEWKPTARPAKDPGVVSLEDIQRHLQNLRPVVPQLPYQQQPLVTNPRYVGTWTQPNTMPYIQGTSTGRVSSTASHISVQDSNGMTHVVPYGVVTYLHDGTWVDENGIVHGSTDRL